MKSFKSHLTEAPLKGKLGKAVSAGGHGGGSDEKGWAHKSGKIIVWKGMKPFHIQYIVKNLSKFGLKEKEVLDVLEARMDSFDSPDPREDAKKHLQELIAGTPYDRDPSIEYLAMKKGWCRVVLGKFSSIGGYDIKTIHQVAIQIDKKKDWTKGIKSLELWEYGESNGSIKKGNHATTKMAGSLDNAYDIGIWVKRGGDPDRIGSGRSEIGRTLAQFREDKKIYPDSYLKNKRLMDLVKKHKDPLKFLFAVIDQMNRGKLHLKRIGAASTREVAALWNDYNNKQIPMHMIEEFIKNYNL